MIKKNVIKMKRRIIKSYRRMMNKKIERQKENKMRRKRGMNNQ